MVNDQMVSLGNASKDCKVRSSDARLVYIRDAYIRKAVYNVLSRLQ
jgi:hypothetical protein